MKLIQHFIVWTLLLTHSYCMHASFLSTRFMRVKPLRNKVMPALGTKTTLHRFRTTNVRQRTISTTASIGAIAASVGSFFALRRMLPSQRLKRAHKIISNVKEAMEEERSLTHDNEKYAVAIRDNTQADDIPFARAFDRLNAHQVKLSRAHDLLNKITDNRIQGLARATDDLREIQDSIERRKKTLCAQPDFNSQWKHLNTRSAAERASSSSNNDWFLYYMMWQLMHSNSSSSAIYQPTHYDSTATSQQHLDPEENTKKDNRHQQESLTSKLQEETAASNSHSPQTDITSDLSQSKETDDSSSYSSESSWSSSPEDSSSSYSNNDDSYSSSDSSYDSSSSDSGSSSSDY